MGIATSRHAKPASPTETESRISFPQCTGCKDRLSIPWRALYEITERRYGDHTDLAPPTSLANEIEIRHELAMLRSTELTWSAEVSRRESQVDDFKGGAIILHHHIAVLAKSLRPINQLPTEILARIFRLVVLVERRRYKEPVNLAPLRLALVCARWRAIMLANKRLWAVITLDINSVSFDESGYFTRNLSAAHVSTVKAYLDRSGSMPLSVFIYAPSRYSTCAHAAVDLLVAQSHRWARVKLSVSGQYFEDGTILDSIRDNLPNLESLILDVGSTEIDHFRSAPKLRQLVTRKDTQPFKILLPWKQLTSFRGQDCDARRLLGVLVQCPQGAQWRIDGFRCDGLYEPSQTHISSALRSLFIKILNESDWNSVWGLSHLLKNLTLPDLRCLTLVSTTRDTSDNVWMHHNLLSFFLRSNCQLDTLILMQVYVEQADLMNILALVPTLTVLKMCGHPHLYYTSINETLLHALTYHPVTPTSSDAANAPLLPHLTHLWLDGLERIYLEERQTLLLDMFQSRLSPNCSLESRTCLQVAELGPENSASLRDLSLYRISIMRSQGMNVKLFSTLPDQIRKHRYHGVFPE